ncbi:WYL domain-containing protein [Paenibacillus koleovorans]|uniref:WYL domain-containing protein n=1 Tax=Paenibacillus koleovorans TaxID=121608 RepID=UPI000FD6EBD4|nr:WYL domain-containing protein [Paenibacillus koleovorans]
MNPFEKIFNYRMISRLDESNSLALTGQERNWLKTMLKHEAAAQAFTSETLGKLDDLLQGDGLAGHDIRDIVLEKARSRERQVYHPHLRLLRRMIMSGRGIRLTFRIKHGGIKANQTGLPVKLEYSMVKREWYLLWHSSRGRAFMSTKLSSIVAVEETSLPLERVREWRAQVAELLESRKEQAVVEVVRTYNEELSRILYAFSCFDKSVSYAEEADLYRIRVTYLADEREFLLAKVRFLGLRVKVVEGAGLQQRMLESATKALERYGDGTRAEAETGAGSEAVTEAGTETGSKAQAGRQAGSEAEARRQVGAEE